MQQMTDDGVDMCRDDLMMFDDVVKDGMRLGVHVLTSFLGVSCASSN
jgi:hypothetical protein